MRASTNKPYSKFTRDFNPIHTNPYFAAYATASPAVPCYRLVGLPTALLLTAPRGAVDALALHTLWAADTLTHCRTGRHQKASVSNVSVGVVARVRSQQTPLEVALGFRTHD